MRTFLLVALVACAIGALLVATRQHIYAGIARLSGTDDMGPVDFATLRRRSSPNDALVCPPGHCPHARPDREPKTYDMTAAELSARLMRIVLAEPATGVLHCAPPCEGFLRFVQYSRIMRFPDTIDVEILPVGDDKSTLAIYSRSLVGHGDLGVNRARIERWLAALDKAT